MLKKIILLKNLSHILSFVLLLGLCLVSFNLLAQTNTKDSLKSAAGDSISVSNNRDSISAKSDSLVKPNTKGMDSLQIKNEKGDIEGTIFYHAEDSIMMDAPNKKAYLYGKAQIKYQDMQLDAEQIEIQWDKNIITARGAVDTSGRYRGKPVWKQGEDTYVTDSMKYNMQSKKGIIHGIETKQGEGFLQGDTSKRTEDAIYLKNGIYTTCNLKHPHFKITARRLKVIPGDRAFCGPFNMVFEDIPTPIGFWLGFFPITDKKKSGIIVPTFGENQSRGLYLSHGGYYWAVNDYLGIQAVGDLYANGSWLLNTDATYIKKYKYRGTMDLGLSKVKNGFDNSEKASTQFSLAWQHTTIAKRSGNFIANVNLTSSKYAKSNYATTNRTQNITTSSVTYNRAFARTPFNTSISMRASQNIYQATAINNTSAIYNVTLPAVSLTMNRINPLKRKYGDGSKWYEKIYINYQGNFNYDLKNTQKFFDPIQKIYRDSSLQVNEANLHKYILPNSLWTSTHTATVSTTLKLFKYLNLNPSVNYFENLYQNKLVYNNISDTAKVVDTVRGLYAAHYVNTSVQLTTRIYGRLDFKGKGLIRGIRHTANPSIQMTYSPDFSKLPGGGWIAVPGVKDEKGVTKRYFQYQGNPTPQFKQEVVAFSLSNIIEMKVRNRKDTSGTNGTKKINLLDNLSLGGSYNFGADSLKMSNVTVSARTKLLNRFDINMSSALDPYVWREDSMRTINGQKVFYNERKINTFLAGQTNGRFAQMSLMNLTIGTRFAPKKKTATKNPNFNNPQMQAELNYIKANPNQYIDFNVPWSLALSFTYNYTHNGNLDPVINQALSASGDISITPKWKVVYSTGYNFRDHAITYSNFTISRDLHCWQMNMTLSPFGTLRTFNFMIAAKSQLLQTLKLNKRSPSFVQ